MGVMVGDSAGGTAIGVAPGAKWIAVKIFPDSDTGLLQVSFFRVFSGFSGCLPDQRLMLSTIRGDLIRYQTFATRPFNNPSQISKRQA